MLRQLLISAYTRLDDRDLYAEILDAHLRDRRKTMVSRLDLHGQITFGDTALQLGPAFDKTEVSKTDAVPEQKMIEPNKPKWEGTKIVKSSSKKFGTFGSGGRRDALKAAQARKAKLETKKATSDW